MRTTSRFIAWRMKRACSQGVISTQRWLMRCGASQSASPLIAPFCRGLSVVKPRKRQAMPTAHSRAIGQHSGCRQRAALLQPKAI
jgi:hypothetical protein